MFVSPIFFSSNRPTDSPCSFNAHLFVHPLPLLFYTLCTDTFQWISFLAQLYSLNLAVLVFISCKFRTEITVRLIRHILILYCVLSCDLVSSIVEIFFSHCIWFFFFFFESILYRCIDTEKKTNLHDIWTIMSIFSIDLISSRCSRCDGLNE